MDRIRASPSAARAMRRARRVVAYPPGLRATLLPTVLVGLLLASGARGAVPGPADDAVVMHAGAWLGACDNLRDCTLFGFADDDSAVLTLFLPRARGPSGRLLLRPEHPLRSELVHLQFGRRGAVLVVRAAAAGPAQARAVIDDAAARSLATQLRQTGRVLLIGASARAEARLVPLASIRPAGASAVLDWIGRTQRRPPVPATPLDRMSLPDPSWPPPAAMPATIAALPAVRACARLDSAQPGQGPAGTTLSRRVVLWRVPCGSDNFSQDSLFVLEEGAHAATARFDSPPQFPARPAGILVNAETDEAGVLSASEPSRGLEDCGDVRRYRWDGTRFRLLQAQLMPACHGLAMEDWPVVYRAGAVDMQP